MGFTHEVKGTKGVLIDNYRQLVLYFAIQQKVTSLQAINNIEDNISIIIVQFTVVVKIFFVILPRGYEAPEG